MKLADLRDMEDMALLLRERDFAEQYTAARFQHYTSNLPSTAKLKALRRDIARIKTVIRQREIERGLPVGGLSASVRGAELRAKTKYDKIRAQFGAESSVKG